MPHSLPPVFTRLLLLLCCCCWRCSKGKGRLGAKRRVCVSEIEECAWFQKHCRVARAPPNGGCWILPSSQLDEVGFKSQGRKRKRERGREKRGRERWRRRLVLVRNESKAQKKMKKRHNATTRRRGIKQRAQAKGHIIFLIIETEDTISVPFWIKFCVLCHHLCHEVSNQLQATSDYRYDLGSISCRRCMSIDFSQIFIPFFKIAN